MKLQTYNYIKQCLEMGHIVKMCNEDGITFTVHLSENMISENYACSVFSDTVEIIPRIPKLLQTGQKCVIIDTEETRKWAEDNDWDFGKKENIGNVVTIRDVSRLGYYEIETGYGIPYFMVAPVPPEENKLADVDTEDMVKELESRGLLVDGKVLK